MRNSFLFFPIPPPARNPLRGGNLYCSRVELNLGPGKFVKLAAPARLRMMEGLRGRRRRLTRFPAEPTKTWRNGGCGSPLRFRILYIEREIQWKAINSR